MVFQLSERQIKALLKFAPEDAAKDAMVTQDRDYRFALKRIAKQLKDIKRIQSRRRKKLPMMSKDMPKMAMIPAKPYTLTEEERIKHLLDVFRDSPRPWLSFEQIVIASRSAAFYKQQEDIPSRSLLFTLVANLQEKDILKTGLVYNITYYAIK